MLLAQPLLETVTYQTIPNSYSKGLELIHKLGGGSTENGKKQFQMEIDLQRDLDQPLISLIIEHENGKKLEWHDDEEDKDYKKLRIQEIQIFTLDLPEPNRYIAIYDMRTLSRFQAALGIIQTIIVCLILSAGALFFQKMTSELVITPIDNMIKRVNHISKDPLKAAYEEEERLLLEEMMVQEM